MYPYRKRRTRPKVNANEYCKRYANATHAHTRIHAHIIILIHSYVFIYTWNLESAIHPNRPFTQYMRLRKLLTTTLVFATTIRW